MSACLLATLLRAGHLHAADPAATSLVAPEKLASLRLADVDGDGLSDIVGLAGRTLHVWRGVRGGAPTPAATLRAEVPRDVSFVDVSRTVRPALLGLGAGGPVRLRLDRAASEAVEPLAGWEGTGLAWSDATQAVFARLHPGRPDDPTAFLPTPRGWRLLGSPRPALERLELPHAPRLEVVGDGAFLDQGATVSVAYPHLFVADDPRGDADYRVWTLSDGALTCLTASPPLAYDLSFLPHSGQRTLLDLDGDRIPDLVHRDGDNREGRYAFFRVPAPHATPREGGGVTLSPGGDLRPPAAFLRLSGFNLEPDYVDVNADGRLDFVLTTIAIDAPNTYRAVSSGKVTATTLCFLQRSAPPGQPIFPPQPDASVTSDIGVKIRFGAAGNIDVARSFTIVSTADVDGDGRKDLLIRVGPEALLVRRGVAGGVWATEGTRVNVPPLGPGEDLEAHAADLDAAPGDELVLHYRAPPGRPDRLVVLRLDGV